MTALRGAHAHLCSVWRGVRSGPGACGICIYTHTHYVHTWRIPISHTMYIHGGTLSGIVRVGTHWQIYLLDRYSRVHFTSQMINCFYKQGRKDSPHTNSRTRQWHSSNEGKMLKTNLHGMTVCFEKAIVESSWERVSTPPWEGFPLFGLVKV